MALSGEIDAGGAQAGGSADVSRHALMLACAALFLPLCALAAPPILYLADSEDPAVRKIYIVQLKTPSVAEFVRSSQTAAIGSRSSKLAASRAPRVDKSAASVQNHLAMIQAQQQRVLTRAGDNTEKIYSYSFGLNGFAALMSPGQAHKLRHLPEVQSVWEDEIRPLATRHSPTFLGLFDADGGLFSDLGLDGDGVVIGVIDSGVYPEHPALSDTQEADGRAPAEAHGRRRACSGAGCADGSMTSKIPCCSNRLRTGTAVATRASDSKRKTATTNSSAHAGSSTCACQRPDRSGRDSISARC